MQAKLNQMQLRQHVPNVPNQHIVSTAIRIPRARRWERWERHNNGDAQFTFCISSVAHACKEGATLSVNEDEEHIG